MTYFAIFTSDANLVESFDEEAEANEALAAIGRENPDEASEYAVIAFGDDGLPVENQRVETAADLLAHL